MDILEQIKELIAAQGAMEAVALQESVEQADTALLDKLVDEGELCRTKRGKYALPYQVGLHKVRIQGNARGFAFGLSEDGDYYISPDDLNGALNGDIVFLSPIEGRGASRSGKVVRVIKRGNTFTVGVFRVQDGHGSVLPDDRRLPSFPVSLERSSGAQDGDKVVASLPIDVKAGQTPEGTITEVLGRAGDTGVDILSIVRQMSIRDVFPPEVLQQAAEQPQQVPEVLINRREDLRDRTIFTIDGEDAKDFDDAVSITPLEKGEYELGVHIADVAEYVTLDSPLDKEAQLRGTSVYLLDRVVPMLPFALSNGICSLNPKVDRLALSVFMRIDHQGKVLESRIAESVIRSCERLTYTKVTGILEGNRELREQYAHILPELDQMAILMDILTNKRIRRGALDFGMDEAEITLDEYGKPIDIAPRKREVSHRLIEEFMIVCNETVAEYLYWGGHPCIYRVHQEPDEEKFDALRGVLNAFGHRFKGKTINAHALQDLLERIEGSPEELLISRLLLRSMKKAIYSPDNTGHFGLASPCYCHFTSPIRRYPDLIVHRLLKTILNGHAIEAMDLPYIAEHSSLTERISDEAERAVDDLKKAEYMMDHIGEEYVGLVSGLTPSAFYVELDNTVEGVIRLADLRDHYDLNEKLFLFVGKRTRKTIRLGDKVHIRVKSADPGLRLVSFTFLDEPGGERMERTERSERTDRPNRTEYKSPAKNSSSKDPAPQRENKEKGMLADPKKEHHGKSSSYKKYGRKPAKSKPKG